MTEELPTIPMPENTGVIPRDPQPGDFMAEGETGIEYEVNLPEGRWPVYCPIHGSIQVGVYFDGSTCTNHACTHNLFMYINWLLKNNKIPATDIAKLEGAKFIVNGELQLLSPRYNAIKSGTKWLVGNYLYKPWDSARHDGMVPESVCPFPRLQRTPVFTQDDYYNPAAADTPECRAAAAVFKEVFDTRYEIVAPTTEQMVKHKMQAPLAIISGVCKPWDGSLIPACSLTSGHATSFNDHEDKVFKGDYDSYDPQQKKLAWDYIISYAIKGLVYVRSTMPKPVIPTPEPAVPSAPKYKFTQKLQFGSRGTEVAKAQELLQRLGCFPASVKPTGYYGLVTKKAVLAFQLKYNLDNPVSLNAWGGAYWGARSIAKANELV